MSFVVIFKGQGGEKTYRTVTWHNYHKIAAEMSSTGHYATKLILTAKLENELKRREGR